MSVKRSGGSVSGLGSKAIGLTIHDEGDALTQRTILNFVGGGVTAIDEAEADPEYHQALASYTLLLHAPLDDASDAISIDDTTSAVDGTIVDAPTLGTVGNPTASTATCISFDGTNDAITFPYDSAYTSGVTIICWYKGTDAGAGGWTPLIQADDSFSAKLWQVGLDSDGYAFFAQGDSYVKAQGTSDIADDTWHMIAGAFTASGTTYLWVDGVLEDTATSPDSGSGSPLVRIMGGGRINQYTSGLSGDVAIVDGVMSTAQVLALYGTKDNSPSANQTIVTIPSGTTVHTVSSIEPATPSTGDVWVNPSAATSGVTGYGGGLYLPADTAPDTADSDDDEFDDGSITGWTEQHAGSAATWAEEDGFLFVEASAESGWALKTQTKALPGSGDWEYELAIAVVNAPLLNYMRPANIVLIEGTTSQKAYVIGHQGLADKIDLGLLTSYSAFSVGVGTSRQHGTLSAPHYLRIAKVGTTFYWKVSLDGQYFHTHYSSSSLAFTPTAIGIGCNIENATYGGSGVFKYFRRIS